MNTYKVPPARRFVRKSRPLDFVYDPIYTVPSKVDFYRSANYATRAVGGAKIKLYTNYPAMFSDVRTDYRVHACLEPPQGQYMENFLPNYNVSGLPISPMECGPPFPRMDDVSGADRAKYCIKYTSEIERLPAYHLASTSPQDRKRPRDRIDQKPFKSRGTQTDLREVETQTDPYSPPYALPHPEDYPKVLALVKMTWGKGLPVTLDDIVTIERALTRRLLELSDRENHNGGGGGSSSIEFRKRVKVMEKLEAQQWADREMELEKIRIAKMDVINKQLQEMKVKMAKDQTNRLEALFEKKKRENTKKLQDIKSQYLRQLRKLERKYRQGPRKFKRDIILDYIDMESSIYAPLVRNGPNVDQLNYAPDYQFTAHHDLETLTYLTEMDSFVKKHLEFDLKGFATRVKKLKPTRATKMVEKQLEDCFLAFKNVCGPKEETAEDEMLNSMIMKSVRRLSTPDEEIVCEEDEEEEAIVLLQTLIRGRAVQSILRQEAENNMETILQLKSAYETDPFGALQPIGEKIAIRQQQRERDAIASQASEEKELVEQIEGEVLAHMMSFLEKEMTRLLDERKIHALILLAERERRMLEASEAGRRQKEEECLRANDEIWRQVVGVHQQTVDMYLEDIYLETINRSADEGGRKYVQELASTVNEAAYLMEKNIKDYDKDEIAADLVHSFLFPQVKRENVQRAIADLHGRYYSVATQVTSAVFNSKGIIQSVLDSVGEQLKKQLDVGHKAMDGSYCAVEEIIHYAVQAALKKEKETTKDDKVPHSTTKKTSFPPGVESQEPVGETKRVSKGSSDDTIKESEILSTSDEVKNDSNNTETTEGEESEEKQEQGQGQPIEEGMLEKTVASDSKVEQVITSETTEVVEDFIDDDDDDDDDSKKQQKPPPKEEEEKGDDEEDIKDKENKIDKNMEDKDDQSEKVEDETDRSSTEVSVKSESVKTEEEEPKELKKEEVEKEKMVEPSSSLHEEDKKKIEDEPTKEISTEDRKVGILSQTIDKSQPLSTTPKSLTIEVKQQEERKEIVSVLEEKDPWKIPIEIDTGLCDLLGLKSLELQTGTEIGETIVKVFDAACITVKDTFDEIEKCLLSDDDEQDEELDDEIEDEDGN